MPLKYNINRRPHKFTGQKGSNLFKLTPVTEQNQIWRQQLLLRGFEPFARRMHLQCMQYREEKTRILSISNQKGPDQCHKWEQ